MQGISEQPDISSADARDPPTYDHNTISVAVGLKKTNKIDIMGFSRIRST
jgi:hypothetical protein